MSIEKLKRLASAIGSVEFHTEGFEQIVGNGTFYGGLIVHEDGETLIAQCVLEPWASYIAAANPKAVLELIAELEARTPAATAERRVVITLRQAHRLVEFFGGHDAIVTVTPPLKDWEQQEQGLYAYCTEYPEDGAQYLGPTEVDDELMRLGERTPAAPVVAEGLIPTEQQILDAAEKAGLWPNTVHSWIPALMRYHAILTAHPVAGSPAEADEVPISRSTYGSLEECEKEAARRRAKAEPMPASEAPSGGDWPEDFQHENGNYENRCSSCGSMFIGHKGRITCKRCATAAPVPASEAASLDTLEFRQLLFAYAVAVHENKSLAAMDGARAAIFAHLAAPAAPTDAKADGLAEMEARKDAAYLERNQVVAALAKCFPSGVARTAIEGWSEDWHGCVYIDLPTGQASWHFHDSQAYLFDGLPPYQGAWDGHTTDEKYARLAALTAAQSVRDALELGEVKERQHFEERG